MQPMRLACRHRNHPDDRCNLSSRQLSIVPSGPILQAIRHNRIGSGPIFAAGGAANNTVLAAYFLKPTATKRDRRSHQPSLSAHTGWSLRHRFATVGLGLALFAATMASTRYLPSGFMPATDSARSVLSIELPPGSQLRDTEAVTQTITQRLRSRPEVESVFVDGGRIPPSVVDVGSAALTINYVPKSTRKLSQQQLEQVITADLFDIPNIRFWFVDENGLRGVNLIVTGDDNATVANVAEELNSQMESTVDSKQRCVGRRA